MCVLSGVHEAHNARVFLKESKRIWRRGFEVDWGELCELPCADRFAVSRSINSETNQDGVHV